MTKVVRVSRGEGKSGRPEEEEEEKKQIERKKQESTYVRQGNLYVCTKLWYTTRLEGFQLKGKIHSNGTPQ